MVKMREKGSSCVACSVPAGLVELLDSGQGPEPVGFSCATLIFKLVKLTGKRGGN